jgi:L-asparagine transporter-like permease
MDDMAEDLARSEPLGRTLKSRHVTMIAVGGIIGAGLFVGSSASIATVGPAVIVSYGLAGLLVLLVMRLISEMSVADPAAGSFTELIRGGLGNWGGFVSGWLYWYFWVVVVPIETLAGAGIVHNWLPLETWQIGIVLLASMTAINLTSARSYGEFEFWLSSIKVAAIVAFIAVAAAYAFGVTSPSGATWANLYAHGGFAPAGVTAIFAGVTSVIFALTGAEIATVAAAESADPAKTVASITSSVALRILIFYVLAIGLIVSVISWQDVKPGVSPFATALSAMHIPGAALIMSWVVLVAVMSCLNSALYITSRVLFVLASRGDAPTWLVQVNPRRVPERAIIISSLFGYLALAASILSPTVIFSFLVNASGATMLFIYLMLCVAQLRKRAEYERTDPGRLAVKMWFHPWSTYAVIAGILGVLGAMAATAELASQLYLSLLVTVLVGGVYVLRRRKRARNLPCLSRLDA